MIAIKEGGKTKAQQSLFTIINNSHVFISFIVSCMNLDVLFSWKQFAHRASNNVSNGMRDVMGDLREDVWILKKLSSSCILPVLFQSITSLLLLGCCTH